MFLSNFRETRRLPHFRVHIHRVIVLQQLREMEGRSEHLSLRSPSVAASATSY